MTTQEADNTKQEACNALLRGLVEKIDQLREADRDLTPRFGERGYRPKLFVVKDETN